MKRGRLRRFQEKTKGRFQMTRRNFAGLITCLILGMGSQSFALTIALNDITPGGMAPAALAGFTAAADRWEALFSDPVTVRIDVGFEDLATGILGSAGSDTYGLFYSTLKPYLLGDATSSDDATAVASLPAGSSLRFRTNDSSGAVILDADASVNNRVLDVNRANLKALGVLMDDGLKDAEIKFNTDFTFDFDPSNGITAGAYDFVGVATHEIGHALGFVSGVDIVDSYTYRPPAGSDPGYPGIDLNPYRVFSVLDLFRYSADSLALGGPETLDLATGGTPYFSIDGGTTSLATFATGKYHGDGRQASHWKDNLGIGILDPTFGTGELGVISARDIQALDVIGWNLASVPEPNTLFLLGSGLFGLCLLWRRHRPN
jgi:hypothetical protein